MAALDPRHSWIRRAYGQTMSDTIVIVGGGLAGARAAETLRGEGFEGPISLICGEDELPYERPVLSKGYLLGSEERNSAYIHDADWYSDQRIGVKLGSPVAGLDLTGRVVRLASGEEIHYGQLLITTGSLPRKINIDGADLPGVHYLRDIGDSDAILKTIDSGNPMVIVGAGWIGLEIASAARQHDVAVTVLEVADLPLQRVLGDEVAKVFADLHRDHGVDLRLGSGIASIEGKDGQVTGVVTTEGESIPAAAVIVGIGAAPAIDWATSAGLAGDKGINVDAQLRTSDEHVFAAGDVAAAEHPLLRRRVRIEHWAWANDSGPVAAKAMLGQDIAIDFLPFFYSDQYDLGMEYIGYVEPGEADRVVVRGDTAKREFQAFWLKHGKVLAGMHANMWDDGIDPIKELVLAGQQVDADALADPSVALSEVVKQPHR